LIKIPTKKKKNRKQRGSRYCGWGQVGQHRKSGMRGGKGRAGGRKHFWIRTVKYEPERYQHKGFKPPSSKLPPPTIINVGDLDNLILSKQVSVKDGVINLTTMGFDKLLGRGSVLKKYDIIVDDHSERAKRKIEDKNGSIISRNFRNTE
jgi:large subunit ribosomal protein L15